MMYSNGFVVAVICNAKISKETMDGIIPIPFDNEYIIRLRNRNNRNAVATIKIDGENVSADGFIVRANSFVDIERSVDKAVKFKFVSSDSQEAIDFGKNNKSDFTNGLIVVEWKFEKIEKPVYTNVFPLHYPPGVRGFMPMNSSEENTSKGILAEGCTVEGAASSQTFQTRSMQLEDSIGATIVMKLQGFNMAKPTPVHLYCSNCGSCLHDYDVKFCSECGFKLWR